MAGVTRTVDFNAGTNGATITAAGQIAQVTGTPTFSNDGLHGGMGMGVGVAAPTNASTFIRVDLGASPVSHSGQFYYRPKSQSASFTTILRFGDSANAALFSINQTTTKFDIRDATGTTVATSSLTWADQWYRFEWQVDLTTPTVPVLTLRIYATPEAFTPTETLTPTLSTSLTFARWLFGAVGIGGSSSTRANRFDTIRIADGSLEWIAPFVPAYTGSLALTGSGAQGDTGTPATTVPVAFTGAGTLAAAKSFPRFIGQYVPQADDDSIAMIPPGGTLAEDITVLVTGNKLAGAVPDPVPGCTWRGDATLGTGPDGLNTGQMRVSVWSKVLTGTATSDTITVPSGNVVVGTGMVYRKDTGDTWAAPTILFASDTASGTAFQADMLSSQGFQPGEWLLSVGFVSAETGFPGRGITLPGCTVDNQQINSAAPPIGNRLSLWTDQLQVLSGAQSAPASTIGTTDVATTGGAVHVRIGLSEVHSGSVGLTGSGVLAGAGTPRAVAALGLTGSGQQGDAGTPAVTAAVPLAGSGVVTAAGAPGVGGNTAFVGTGALGLQGGLGAKGDLQFAGAGVLDTAGISTPTGSLALAGAGALGATGTPAHRGGLLLEGGSVLAAVGTPAATAVLALAGAGQFAAAKDIPVTPGRLTSTVTQSITGAVTASRLSATSEPASSLEVSDGV